LSIVAAKAEPAQGYGLPHQLVHVARAANSRSRQAQSCHFNFTRTDDNQPPKKVLKKAAAPGGAVMLNVDYRLVAPRSPRPHRSVFAVIICGAVLRR
jgi:hypothetical protein